MLTSLAPSPIARVVPHYLTILVIYYLSLGETLQHITLYDYFRMLIRYWRAYESIFFIKSPEITVTFLLFIKCNIEVRLTNKALACYASQSKTILYIFFYINPAANPIEIAVYFLSPVSIHTFIPLYFKLWIVLRTSGCNLSYIAVAPITRHYC